MITELDKALDKIFRGYEERAYSDLVPSGYGGCVPNKGFEDWEENINLVRKALVDITQQPALDSEVEEALEWLSEFNEQSRTGLPDNVYFDLIHYFNTVKQALVDKESQVSLLKRDLKSRDLMRKLTVGKLQTKLDKVEKMLNSHHPMSYRMGIIKEMFKEDNNENS